MTFRAAEKWVELNHQEKKKTEPKLAFIKALLLMER